MTAHPAVDVPCPECKRPAGVRCITLDTQEPTDLVHRARNNSWLQQDARVACTCDYDPGLPGCPHRPWCAIRGHKPDCTCVDCSPHLHLGAEAVTS